jgi:hypothetical protein
MAVFFYAGYRADQAMDKSGIGDYQAFAWWDRVAGNWFWASVTLWLATSVACALLAHRGQLAKWLAVTYTTLTPLAFVVTWFAMMVL